MKPISIKIPGRSPGSRSRLSKPLPLHVPEEATSPTSSDDSPILMPSPTSGRGIGDPSSIFGGLLLGRQYGGLFSGTSSMTSPTNSRIDSSTLLKLDILGSPSHASRNPLRRPTRRPRKRGQGRSEKIASTAIARRTKNIQKMKFKTSVRNSSGSGVTSSYSRSRSRRGRVSRSRQYGVEERKRKQNALLDEMLRVGRSPPRLQLSGPGPQAEEDPQAQEDFTLPPVAVAGGRSSAAQQGRRRRPRPRPRTRTRPRSVLSESSVTSGMDMMKSRAEIRSRHARRRLRLRPLKKKPKSQPQPLQHISGDNLESMSFLQHLKGAFTALPQSFLEAVQSAHTILANDSAEEKAVIEEKVIPPSRHDFRPSRVPAEYFVYASTPLTGTSVSISPRTNALHHPFFEEARKRHLRSRKERIGRLLLNLREEFDHRRREFERLVFPSAHPSKRVEVFLLAKTLDAMLHRLKEERMGLSLIEDEDDTEVEICEDPGTSEASQAWLRKEQLREEHGRTESRRLARMFQVHSIGIDELARQIATNSVERAVVLRRMNEFFNWVFQAQEELLTGYRVLLKSYRGEIVEFRDLQEETRRHMLQSKREMELVLKEKTKIFLKNQKLMKNAEKYTRYEWLDKLLENQLLKTKCRELLKELLRIQKGVLQGREEEEGEMSRLIRKKKDDDSDSDDGIMSTGILRLDVARKRGQDRAVRLRLERELKMVGSSLNRLFDVVSFVSELNGLPPPPASAKRLSSVSCLNELCEKLSDVKNRTIARERTIRVSLREPKYRRGHIQVQLFTEETKSTIELKERIALLEWNIRDWTRKVNLEEAEKKDALACAEVRKARIDGLELRLQEVEDSRDVLLKEQDEEITARYEHKLKKVRNAFEEEKKKLLVEIETETDRAAEDRHEKVKVIEEMKSDFEEEKKKFEGKVSALQGEVKALTYQLDLLGSEKEKKKSESTKQEEGEDDKASAKEESEEEEHEEEEEGEVDGKKTPSSRRRRKRRKSISHGRLKKLRKSGSKRRVSSSSTPHTPGRRRSSGGARTPSTAKKRRSQTAKGGVSSPSPSGRRKKKTPTKDMKPRSSEDGDGEYDDESEKGEKKKSRRMGSKGSSRRRSEGGGEVEYESDGEEEIDDDGLDPQQQQEGEEGVEEGTPRGSKRVTREGRGDDHDPIAEEEGEGEETEGERAKERLPPRHDDDLPPMGPSRTTTGPKDHDVVPIHTMLPKKLQRSGSFEDWDRRVTFADEYRDVPPGQLDPRRIQSSVPRKLEKKHSLRSRWKKKMGSATIPVIIPPSQMEVRIEMRRRRGGIEEEDDPRAPMFEQRRRRRRRRREQESLEKSSSSRVSIEFPCDTSPKSLLWLLRLMTQVYDGCITEFKNGRRIGSAPFSSLVYLHLSRLYGLHSIVRDIIAAIMKTISNHGSSDARIRIFEKFLSTKWRSTKEALGQLDRSTTLSRFLAIWKVFYETEVGPRFLPCSGKRDIAVAPARTSKVKALYVLSTVKDTVKEPWVSASFLQDVVKRINHAVKKETADSYQEAMVRGGYVSEKDDATEFDVGHYWGVAVSCARESILECDFFEILGESLHQVDLKPPNVSGESESESMAPPAAAAAAAASPRFQLPEFAGMRAGEGALGSPGKVQAADREEEGEEVSEAELRAAEKASRGLFKTY